MSRVGTHRAHQFKLLAVSDVHSPRYLLEFMNALSKHKSECGSINAVVFAGDMVEKGKVQAFSSVLNIVLKYCPGKPIIAVFGNEEYIGTEDEYRKRFKEVLWLDDSYTVIDGIAIYGTRGSLDRPTRWQQRNMPWIWRVYRERVVKLKETVARLKNSYSKVVVVMHYAPTYKTIVGEPRAIWPELASKAMEEAIKEVKPTLVVHGHAHKARVLSATIDSVRVINVAFPARRDVTIVDV